MSGNKDRNINDEAAPKTARGANRGGTTRGPRFSGFKFTFPLRLATAQAAAKALGGFATISEYVVATHDRDGNEPHVQGGFTCSTRLTNRDAQARFASLGLPTNELHIKPLVQGSGRGRDAILAYANYLTHSDPTERAKGKAQYPRMSILVSDPQIWERVDAWLDRRVRADIRAGRRPAPLGDLETAKLALLHEWVSIPAVINGAQELWLRHETSLKAMSSFHFAIHVGLSPELSARMNPVLVEQLLHAEIAWAKHRSDQEAMAKATKHLEIWVQEKA